MVYVIVSKNGIQVGRRRMPIRAYIYIIYYIYIQGSTSGGRRMPPGGDANIKALILKNKKMRKQAIKRAHTDA